MSANQKFRCAQCGYTSFNTRFSKIPDRNYGKSGLFNVVECSYCNLLQLEAIPTNLGDFYANYLLHKPRSGFYNLFQFLLVGHLYPIRRAAPGSRILDYGCGNGQYLLRMKSKGWNTFGCEYNSEYAEELERRSGIPILTPEDLFPKYEASFDLITFNFSFEHLVNPEETIRTAKRLLKSSGEIIILVPNPDSFEARLFKENWYHLDPPRHITFFTKHQLSDLLNRAGFSKITIQDVPVATGFAGSISYITLGRWSPKIWYSAILPGFLFSLFVRDGNFSISGSSGS